MASAWLKRPKPRVLSGLVRCGLGGSLENLERVVREVCTADVEPDGMVFEPATV